MKITKKDIIAFIIGILVVLFIMMIINYNLASQVCKKSEIRPVRVDHSGIYGLETYIPTTEENADLHAEICIEHYNPNFFTPFHNLNYALTKLSEQSK